MKRTLGFFALWLAGSVAAVSIAFAGVALVDDEFVNPASARQSAAVSSQQPFPNQTSQIGVEPQRGARADQDPSGSQGEPVSESGADDFAAPVNESADATPRPRPTRLPTSPTGTPSPSPSDSDASEQPPANTSDAAAASSAQAGERPAPTSTSAPTAPTAPPAQSTQTPAPTTTPTAPPAQPTQTPAPTTTPTAPPAQPSQTPPPTNTPAPPPTSTPVPPPTSTPVPPPTNTPVPPPTSTPVPPPTSTPVPPPTSTPVPPPAQVLTFNLVGGSTAIEFSADAVSILWATANPGFEVELEPGDDEVRVDFESDGHESRIDAWWSGGPQHEIREDAD